MHPIDWDVSEGQRVPISVSVDFETKSVRHSRTQGPIVRKQYYRIIRSTYEIIRGEQWERGPTTADLMLLTDAGSEPIGISLKHASKKRCRTSCGRFSSLMAIVL